MITKMPTLLEAKEVLACVVYKKPDVNFREVKLLASKSFLLSLITYIEALDKHVPLFLSIIINNEDKALRIRPFLESHYPDIFDVKTILQLSNVEALARLEQILGIKDSIVTFLPDVSVPECVDEVWDTPWQPFLDGLPGDCLATTPLRLKHNMLKNIGLFKENRFYYIHMMSQPKTYAVSNVIESMKQKRGKKSAPKCLRYSTYFSPKGEWL